MEATDLRAALRESDVCVTCTPARRTFVVAADVAPGMFIAAVGADSQGKQELEPALVASATLVVDVLEQCAEIGELQHALAAGLLTREQVHAELARCRHRPPPGAHPRRRDHHLRQLGDGAARRRRGDRRLREGARHRTRHGGEARWLSQFAGSARRDRRPRSSEVLPVSRQPGVRRARGAGRLHAARPRRAPALVHEGGVQEVAGALPAGAGPLAAQLAICLGYVHSGFAAPRRSPWPSSCRRSS